MLRNADVEASKADKSDSSEDDDSSDEKENDSVFDDNNESELDSNDEEKWDLLGLRAFKISNNDEIINNILIKNPTDAIKVADFDSTNRAQIIYNYSIGVKKSEVRSKEDRREIRRWERTMPPRPEDKQQGFAEGAASKWFTQLYGESHELVLPRVIKKSRDPELKRPDYADYNSRDSLLESDKKLVDSLPLEEFFSSIGSSKNAGIDLISL